MDNNNKVNLTIPVIQAANQNQNNNQNINIRNGILTSPVCVSSFCCCFIFKIFKINKSKLGK
jgi:hypothetical protein